jgi:hypothetical protein
LPFSTVFILILRKSVKSLQVVLNEFILQAGKSLSITASAFTQARRKLKHTSFIELNNHVVSMYYKDKVCKRLHGFRILGVDGS